MKLMSDSIQRAAGAKLRDLLGKLTSNRFKGVLTGTAISCVIQSSSATTVMVVSFVAAKLMTLTQAIGVIMGANIGTTFTAWIVSLVGFQFSLASMALPAAGLGLCLSFFRSSQSKAWGEAMLGFGLLFLGIGLLKDSIPALEGPEQLAFLQSWGEHGFLSVLIFVAVGSILTIILQSSSATMALTLTIAAQGWISYEQAVAMVLGENIGTTATANLAAIGASTEAKRAARVHLLFNVFGVVWAVVLLKPVLLPLIGVLVPGEGDPYTDPMAIPVYLAAFHTSFNVVNTGVMLPFVRQLEALVTRLVPERKNGSRLHFITPTGVEAPELLLIQAGKEMQHMTDVVRDAFSDAMQVLSGPRGQRDALIESTFAKEEELDALEREISENLVRATTSATPPATARKIAEMMENAHRLERIGDHCAVLARIAQRIDDNGGGFQEEDVESLLGLQQLVDQSLENLGRYLAGDTQAAAVAEEIEQQVDRKRRVLRRQQIERMKESTEGVQAKLAFLDTITHLEEIADRVVGIVRRVEQTRQEIAERVEASPVKAAIRSPAT